MSNAIDQIQNLLDICKTCKKKPQCDGCKVNRLLSQLRKFVDDEEEKRMDQWSTNQLIYLENHMHLYPAEHLAKRLGMPVKVVRKKMKLMHFSAEAKVGYHTTKWG